MASTITVITTKSKQKVLEARAGKKTLPAIATMAFGDGGNGWVPTGSDNALKNELLRKTITAIEPLSETRYRYKCLIEKNELQNVTINEMGLVDTEGDFICIIVCGNKLKDDDIEMEFYIDDIMN
jgi:phage-related tail fiber protein|nr:MAG TPA: tail-collar fiber protein [Caudoviricetes sp.]